MRRQQSYISPFSIAILLPTNCANMALPKLLLERHGLRFEGSIGGPVVQCTTSDNNSVITSSPSIQLDNKKTPCKYCKDLLHKVSKDRDDGKDSFRHYALLIDLKASSTDCPMCFALLQTFDSEDVAAAILPSLEHEVWKLYSKDRTFNFYRYSSRVRDFKLKGLYRCKGEFREEENGDEYCSGVTFTFCIGDGEPVFFKRQRIADFSRWHLRATLLERRPNPHRPWANKQSRPIWLDQRLQPRPWTRSLSFKI